MEGYYAVVVAIALRMLYRIHAAIAARIAELDRSIAALEALR